MAAKKKSQKAKPKSTAKKKKARAAIPAKKKKATSKKKSAAPAKKKTAAKKPTKRAAAPAKKKAAAKKKTTAKKKAAPAKKAPAKKKAAAKTAKAAKPVARRDATGHLDKKYAADLHARSEESRDTDDTDAFIRTNRAHDALAEQLGEEAVQAMTTGEDQSDQLQEAEVTEENGGPFVATSGGEEYAEGTDESNPDDATREPFPTT